MTKSSWQRDETFCVPRLLVRRLEGRCGPVRGSQLTYQVAREGCLIAVFMRSGAREDAFTVVVKNSLAVGSDWLLSA